MDEWYQGLIKAEDPKTYLLERPARGIERLRQWRAYAKVCAVQHLPFEKREAILNLVYDDWRNPGALPDGNHASTLLRGFMPGRSSDSMLIEEYRRLDYCMEGRKMLCVDLEGLLVHRRKPLPGIHEAIRHLQEKHGVVISTAMPVEEADTLTKETGLDMPVFGDLGNSKGKRYAPIANHYGFPFPSEKLVAVGHSLLDRPCDIEIPFLKVKNAEELKEATAEL